MYFNKQEDWASTATIACADESQDIQAVEFISGLEMDDGGQRVTWLKEFNTTDLGNAARMGYYFKHSIRYVNGWGWLIFDGRRWCKDETGEIMRVARATVRRIYQEAAQSDDKKERTSLGKWARSSESKPKLLAMVQLAESEPDIAVSQSTFDTDPMLLNCANGTIHLQTGELQSHDPYDFLTRYIDVIYNPDAPCPLWEASLFSMMHCERDLTRYLQRCVGYSLTGLTGEQCLFFLYGNGKNGKSLFADTLHHIFGDYWLKAPASMLIAKRPDAIPHDIARLPGSRMVVSSETSAGRPMDEALVKDLTGDDVVVARFLNKEFFEFKPTAKLWIYGNYKPTIKGNDDGIWRRLRLIPFTVRFYSPSDGDYEPNGPQADANLAQKLAAERAGILAWAVRGCLEWQQEGLGLPQAVQKATQTYREEMDVVGAFLEENCIQGPPRKAPVDTVFHIYTKWCAEDSGEPPLRRKEFNQQIEKRGFKKARSTGGKYYWFGLGLVDQQHTE